MRAAVAAFFVLVSGCAVRHAGNDHAAARAEVQISLCSAPEEIVSGLGLEPVAGGQVEAWYFDDPSLALFARGLVFRLRIKSDESELTLKAADQDCARVPRDLIPRHEGKCEYDLHGKDMKGAVSLSRTLDDRTRRELLAGGLMLQQALSYAQMRYLREAAHAWPLAGGFAPLGPVYIDAYRSAGRPYVVEMWRMPSGRRFIEVSQKTAVEEALRTRSQLEDALAQGRVQACADQGSQARAKLEDLVAK